MSEHNNINTINNNNYSSISYKNYVFDLDKHEVFYIDNLPVNIELYTCLLSSSGSNNILNKLQKKLFKDLTSDEKKYYLFNLLSLKEQELSILSTNNIKLNETITHKRRVIKEVQENIFNKEYDKEKMDNKKKKKEDELKFIDLELEKAKKELEILTEKIKKCDFTINNYQSKSELLEKSETLMSKKTKTKKSTTKLSLSNFSIDNIITELKEEKKRLRNLKQQIQNNILSYEESMKNLLESISILEIKPKNTEDNNLNVGNIIMNK